MKNKKSDIMTPKNTDDINKIIHEIKYVYSIEDNEFDHNLRDALEYFVNDYNYDVEYDNTNDILSIKHKNNRFEIIIDAMKDTMNININEPDMDIDEVIDKYDEAILEKLLNIKQFFFEYVNGNNFTKFDIKYNLNINDNNLHNIIKLFDIPPQYDTPLNQEININGEKYGFLTTCDDNNGVWYLYDKYGYFESTLKDIAHRHIESFGDIDNLKFTYETNDIVLYYWGDEYDLNMNVNDHSMDTIINIIKMLDEIEDRSTKTPLWYDWHNVFPQIRKELAYTGDYYINYNRDLDNWYIKFNIKDENDNMLLSYNSEESTLNVNELSTYFIPSFVFEGMLFLNINLPYNDDPKHEVDVYTTSIEYDEGYNSVTANFNDRDYGVFGFNIDADNNELEIHDTKGEFFETFMDNVFGETYRRIEQININGAITADVSSSNSDSYDSFVEDIENRNIPIKITDINKLAEMVKHEAYRDTFSIENISSIILTELC